MLSVQERVWTLRPWSWSWTTKTTRERRGQFWLPSSTGSMRRNVESLVSNTCRQRLCFYDDILSDRTPDGSEFVSRRIWPEILQIFSFKIPKIPHHYRQFSMFQETLGLGCIFTRAWLIIFTSAFILKLTSSFGIKPKLTISPPCAFCFHFVLDIC